MFITSIAIFIVMLLYSILNIKNRFSITITMYFAALTAMLFCAAIYTARVTLYQFPLKLDYNIYLWFSKIPINMYTLRRLYNFSFGFFMFVSFCSTLQVEKSKPWKIAAALAPILLFIILTDPTVARNADIYYYFADKSFAPVILTLVKLSKIVCMTLLVFYSMYPYIIFIKQYQRTKYISVKRSIIVYMICITIFNLFFYVFFVFGIFKIIIFYNLTPISLPIVASNSGRYLMIPTVIFAFLSLMIIILIYYHPFNIFRSDYHKNKSIIKNTMMLNKNLRMNFHTFKNAFWGMQQQFKLIKKAVAAKDFDRLPSYADDGIDMVAVQLEFLNKTLSNLSSDVALSYNVNVVDCVKAAVKSIKGLKNAEITEKYQQSEILTFANSVVLTEVFSNLLINSLESFDGVSGRNSVIKVEVCTLDNMCIIEVSDNGCGISKSELKNIFKPFYSTKNRGKNSGLGLNYVDTIVKLHHGQVFVTSREGEYTSFQISLPLSLRKH